MLSLIRAILIADTTLTDIVGSKIYPVTIPQEVSTPILLMELLSTDPQDTKESPGEINDVAIQITAFTASYDVGTTIMERVKVLLNDYVSIADGIIQLRFINEYNAWEAGHKAFTKTYGFKGLKR